MSETGDLFSQAVSNLSDAMIRDGLSIVPAPERKYRYKAGTDELLSHRSDPSTSVSAAESMVQGASKHRIAILTALRLFKEQNIYELGDRLGLTHVQVARRTAELCRLGKIQRVVTGRHHGKETYWTRLTPTGRQACVWQIVP